MKKKVDLLMKKPEEAWTEEDRHLVNMIRSMKQGTASTS
jgi:hypothetical protein